MELWTVGNKTIVWLFVIVLSYISHPEDPSLLVLYFLLFLAINLTIHIVKRELAKQGLIVLTLAYVLICGAFVKPEFLLLLPLSFFELCSFFFRRQQLVLVLVLVPMLFMAHAILLHYGLIAVICFFNYVMVTRYMNRVNAQEDELERSRRRQQELGRQLNDNAEYAQASEYLVKLEERNRVAQEIHDGIGHAITGGLIQMEAARLTLRRDLAAAESLLNNAIAISKEGIEEIRRTLKDMKPPVEQLGIGRLRSAVEAFGGKSDMRTTVVHEGSMEVITPLQWKIIHDNVMEGLTNAAKYSGASAVHVEVRVLNGFIKAVVSDNGHGAVKVVKGMGLIGMEERTATVNGTVTADGERGFVVTTLIPRTGT